MRLLMCCFVAVFTLTACNKSDSGWKLETLSSSTEQTNSLSAAQTAGKRIFINYWAEWCKPCITEIPELNHFAQQYQEKVIVLGFNFDQKKGSELQMAMQKAGMAFPATLTDPATVFAIPEVNGLPTTLVLDEQGRLITMLLGPQTIASLEKALLETP